VNIGTQVGRRGGRRVHKHDGPRGDLGGRRLPRAGPRLFAADDAHLELGGHVL